jgi:alpha-beta hydrolase superfamily lysophospholipase
MSEQTSQRKSVTGKMLHLRTWEPEGTPTGALLLSHGLGEHCGRYAHVAEHFTARGFVVYGQDHYGFGLSEGRRGDVPAFEILFRDLLALQSDIEQERGADLRQVLLGHSMGGLIALTLLHHSPGAFTEAMVSGIAINVTRGVNPVLVGLSKVLRWTMPFVTLDNTLKPEELCTDKAVVEAYVADPLVHRRLSSRLFGGMAAAGRRLRTSPGVFPRDLRLLLMHGADDPICFADDTEQLFAALPMEDKTLKIFPGMLHEILNERDQADVLAEIDAFLGLKASPEAL